MSRPARPAREVRETATAGNLVTFHPVTMWNGSHFDVAVNPGHEDDLVRAIEAGQTWFLDDFRLVLERLRPSDTVVDLGANIGVFALAAAALGCRVAAVEGSPVNAALLRASVRRNGFDQVHVISAAATDREGSIRFVSDGQCGTVADPWLPQSEVRHPEHHLIPITVPAVTVDGVLERLGWARVDLIKIDLEGSDLAAMRGMRSVLTRMDPLIFFESNGPGLHQFGESPGTLLALLQGYGYHTFLLEANQLVPAHPADFLPLRLRNGLAMKVPPAPQDWPIRPAWSQEELLTDVLQAVTEVIPRWRIYAALALARAPKAILLDARAGVAINVLISDSNPAVGGAARGHLLPALTLPLPEPSTQPDPSTLAVYRQRQREAVSGAGPYPTDLFQGAGIVIPAGGPRYFTSAYVCVSMLRRLGCTLPIEVWHLGPEEMEPWMLDLLRPLEVRCVDALRVREQHPVRRIERYALKPYAILYSRFKDVILLDADNVPLADPSYLLARPEFDRTGAIFWPDIAPLPPHNPIWTICRLPWRPEPSFESGQMLVDKERSWEQLHLALHLNQWPDFYYRYIPGDRETYHLAWRMLSQGYSMPAVAPRRIPGRFGPDDPYGEVSLQQEDFAGNPLFHHLAGNIKWNAWGRSVSGLPPDIERACLDALAGIRRHWDGWSGPALVPATPARDRDEIVQRRCFLHRRQGEGSGFVELLPDGSLTGFPLDSEEAWRLQGNTLILEGRWGVAALLTLGEDGIWRGRQLHQHQAAIQLIPAG